ncbi:hypothetical protein DSO57_1018260 [Entomophthora muscae]|uniref:Uncharacterized protein n=1 Tax=Entomophthora muscae TaxID=34485 RepID=A0ACC2U3G3_9FUNG|nr:hypothetical protein DSO57_1018260 [Entomophthora muscae]
MCDLQTQFCGRLFGSKWVVHTADKLIKASNILNIPLLVAEQNPTAFGHTIPELDISHATLCEPKSQFSMLTPRVKEALKGVDYVVLFGAEAQYCVLQSCLDLIRLGKHVRIVVDGVSSVNRTELHLAFQRMAHVGAVLATYDSLITELVWDSDHPSFHELLKIGKSGQSLAATNPILLQMSNISSPKIAPAAKKISYLHANL